MSSSWSRVAANLGAAVVSGDDDAPAENDAVPLDTHNGSMTAPPAQRHPIMAKSLFADRITLATENMPWRTKLQSLLDPSMPSPSKAWARASMCISLLVFFLIVVFVIVMMVDSHPMYYNQNNVVIFSIETLCIIVFTIEFVSRFFLSDYRWDFIQTEVISLISIIPYYVEVAHSLAEFEAHPGVLVFLRVMRLARIFRVLKLGSYSTGMFMVIESMRRSTEAITLLAWRSSGFFCICLWCSSRRASAFLKPAFLPSVAISSSLRYRPLTNVLILTLC